MSQHSEDSPRLGPGTSFDGVLSFEGTLRVEGQLAGSVYAKTGALVRSEEHTSELQSPC